MTSSFQTTGDPSSGPSSSSASSSSVSALSSATGPSVSSSGPSLFSATGPSPSSIGPSLSSASSSSVSALSSATGPSVSSSSSTGPSPFSTGPSTSSTCPCPTCFQLPCVVIQAPSWLRGSATPNLSNTVKRYHLYKRFWTQLGVWTYPTYLTTNRSYTTLNDCREVMPACVLKVIQIL